MNNILILGDNQRNKRYQSGLAGQLNQKIEEKARKKITPEIEKIKENYLEKEVKEHGITSLPDFVEIPNTGVEIASYPLSSPGLTFDETHIVLSNENLFLPTPALFFKYLRNVKDWSQGKGSWRGALDYYKNNWISQETAKDLFDFLFTARHSGYETILDAYFDIDGLSQNGIRLSTNHSTNGRKLVCNKANMSSNTLYDENKLLVALQSFNSEGFPMRESQNKSVYVPGQNMFYFSPREFAIATVKLDEYGLIYNCCAGRNQRVITRKVFPCRRIDQKIVSVGGQPAK